MKFIKKFAKELSVFGLVLVVFLGLFLYRQATFKDYKTMLQEIIQQNPEEHLTYVLTGESGPDHNKHFTVEVHLNQNVIGKGGGRSKKDAEQQAAREALELMGY